MNDLNRLLDKIAEALIKVKIPVSRFKSVTPPAIYDITRYEVLKRIRDACDRNRPFYAVREIEKNYARGGLTWMEANRQISIINPRKTKSRPPDGSYTSGHHTQED